MAKANGAVGQSSGAFGGVWARPGRREGAETSRGAGAGLDEFFQLLRSSRCWVVRRLLQVRAEAEKAAAAHSRAEQVPGLAFTGHLGKSVPSRGQAPTEALQAAAEKDQAIKDATAAKKKAEAPLLGSILAPE